ncbi:protein-disulfide reductase DsbD family protein [Parasediminibacterium sp. JCM 36343]|uniref:protein-disulfide reductase DsbD family protein n=1 Tax=Parasediminibacterium sp. JCM 36343 TaxID=3374279 RepID=UPI003978288E
MNKIFLVLLLAGLAIANLPTAQAQAPVQFRFSTQTVNDSLETLIVYAVIPKGVQLFSVKKSIGADAFISTLQLDSSAKCIVLANSVVEKGALQLLKQPDGSEYRLFADSVQFIYQLHVNGSSSTSLKGSFAWLGKKEDEYPAGEEKFTVSIKQSTAKTSLSAPKDEFAMKSVWNIFLLTFLTGLLAMLTPCVFPLIPVTVSFFLKRSGSHKAGLKNALVYSLSIISIYTIPTLLLTFIFGDTILYTIATSPISNLLFFAIFIVFAISFFGAFELSLPNSWANKADEKAGKGGYSGIFFMALTLAIVSFSCTGPIVGTLLGQTSSQGVSIAPIIGMFGFGLGLALPFSLFAFFPTMLKALPKSGGWLNSVKVCFGFIELALAMKFLSSVDLIYHWHLLDRDVFLVLWIVIFAMLGFYLLGKLTFSHDSPLPFVSVPRLFFAIAAFSFSLYMIPGLWGAPLKALSGFIPPATTQDFNLDDLKYSIGNNNAAPATSSSSALPPKKHIDKLHVPFGLKAYFDLEEGMAAAKTLNKPVMIDFTGHSCANCRKMEEQVWKNQAVLSRIKDNFVLVSLYVDESTELSTAEQYSNAKGDKIVTVGEKNLDYEITKFGFNAQPLYMFLDLKGNPLSDVKYGYDSDVEKFIKHLDTVKQAFEKSK